MLQGTANKLGLRDHLASPKGSVILRDCGNSLHLHVSEGTTSWKQLQTFLSFLIRLPNLLILLFSSPMQLPRLPVPLYSFLMQPPSSFLMLLPSLPMPLYSFLIPPPSLPTLPYSFLIPLASAPLLQHNFPMQSPSFPIPPSTPNCHFHLLVWEDRSGSQHVLEINYPIGSTWEERSLGNYWRSFRLRGRTLVSTPCGSMEHGVMENLTF